MSTPPPPKSNFEYVTVADARLETSVSADAESQWRVVGRLNVPSLNRQPSTNEVEYRFRQLADKWLSETAMLSDPVRKFMDRSHLKIIAMGEDVLPLILAEVRKMSGHWFVALDAISPTNPVRPEDQINFERTAQAWLSWGERERLI